MTTPNQISGIYGGLDIAFKNYSGSDIGEYICVAVDTVNLADGGGTAFTGCVLSSNTTFVGVTQTIIPTLKSGLVRLQGVSVCIASATVAPGAALMPDSAGKVLTKTSTNTTMGRCLGSAANTEKVAVLLVPGGVTA